MAVCRKRSTKSAPESLSSSYFTGSPPKGISMMALTSQGGLRPMGILEMSIAFRLRLQRLGRTRSRWRGIAAHHPWEKHYAGQRQERGHYEEIEPTDQLDDLAGR